MKILLYIFAISFVIFLFFYMPAIMLFVTGLIVSAIALSLWMDSGDNRTIEQMEQQDREFGH